MTDRLSVFIVDNPERQRVEALTDSGGVAGFSQYYLRDGSYVFFHTEVDAAYNGQGIGSQIAAGVVAFVRNRQAKLVPECPFIRAYLRKHPDEQDVVLDGASLDPRPDDIGPGTTSG